MNLFHWFYKSDLWTIITVFSVSRTDGDDLWLALVG